eukprot:11088516-Prorocentrum_lima.AAC.1
MTSSLVGSEMCIRDSYFSMMRDTMASELAVLEGTVPNTKELLDIGTTTVSYTHLTLPTICSV